MAVTADEVRVRLVAEMGEYNRRITDATRLTDQAFGKIADAQARTEKQIKQSASSISSTFKGMAGALATYFSGRELAGIIDRFTQFQNKLRVAGVTAADLGAVQDRLFSSAQKYGVELGALGGLYSSLSTASKELGVSQEQVRQASDVRLNSDGLASPTGWRRLQSRRSSRRPRSPATPAAWRRPASAWQTCRNAAPWTLRAQCDRPKAQASDTCER